MMDAGRRTIVNVGSVNAFFQPDGAVIDYGAAKAALLNVAKALSQELGPHGIRIASVAPGPGRRPTCGSARTASPRPSARPMGADADASAQQATAGIPTAASRRRARSRRS